MNLGAILVTKNRLSFPQDICRRHSCLPPSSLSPSSSPQSYPPPVDNSVTTRKSWSPNKLGVVHFDIASPLVTILEAVGAFGGKPARKGAPRPRDLRHTIVTAFPGISVSFSQSSFSSHSNGEQRRTAVLTAIGLQLASTRWHIAYCILGFDFIMYNKTQLTQCFKHKTNSNVLSLASSSNIPRASFGSCWCSKWKKS